MSFQSLRDLKKTTNKIKTDAFYPYLIVGQNFFTLASFYRLRQKNLEDVKIIGPREFTKEDMILKGPNSLRGTGNALAVKCLGHQLVESSHTPIFYKDQKLREFGGRARPETMLYGEEFYGHKAYEFDAPQFFPFLNDPFFVTTANQNLIEGQITKISQVTPEDLIDRAHWALDLSSGMRLTCEHLVWTNGPLEFLALSAKDSLSNDVIQFLESTRTPISLYIRLEFDRVVTDQEATLFLPLSFTHEWGHFVGEFKTMNGKQSAEFITTIDEENSDEGHIAHIIKILKRNLEKVIPSIQNVEMKEFIMMSERTPCLKIDDRAFQRCRDSFKNLSFAGLNAPLREFSLMEKSCEDSLNAAEMPTHLARAILSLEQITLGFVDK
ncbi:MAG: hypothetical protein A2X86_07235 [Bdellovibrionales bacterium GWA2_49_15]|nr:MAG: hypothetical protein A2X86_07235 [Bdellovibrionales bacterium GWA2_49_15]HAZ11930.1 hypothetical protein [Bdellovibrionales bacterium]